MVEPGIEPGISGSAGTLTTRPQRRFMFGYYLMFIISIAVLAVG
jgi:hypothetical protein